MSDELLINITPQETRVAYVENGVLQEVHIEREKKRGLVGNIYTGKVNRVLPGMQAAFIDIGLDRTAFLHASDIYTENVSYNENSELQPEIPISELLHEGQRIKVQVLKDPIGTKGARLTTQISIPSRYLVYMPQNSHIGISQKIESEEERERLKIIISNQIENDHSGGYIVRTVAQGISSDLIIADMLFLQKMWSVVTDKEKQESEICLIHEDFSLVMRTMRDLVGTDFEKVRIDSKETHLKVSKFATKFIPNLDKKIDYYPGERPIFDIYGIEDEIQKAMEPKVLLKSGGYLIIDQTEAMTTVDVNTGAFVGHRNLEETIFKTNLEATQSIARQIRLRNLGGIIIIDFIDMLDPDHRKQVLRLLEKNLERDHAKTNISEVSSLGLVQMTRKRTRESLEHILCEVCPTCNGRGSIKTAETVCFELFREILRESRQFNTNDLLILASPEVVDVLLDEESNSVAELEVFIDKNIRFQVETQYSQEQFDVVLM
ncbi:MAG: ribonuclease G [Thiohalomonadales bacterium]